MLPKMSSWAARIFAIFSVATGRDEVDQFIVPKSPAGVTRLVTVRLNRFQCDLGSFRWFGRFACSVDFEFQLLASIPGLSSIDLQKES